jgi:hypothetical protein
LLLSDKGRTVVDVQAAFQLSKPKVSFTRAWTKDVVERRSWRHEAWSEPPEAEPGNPRFLAGFPVKAGCSTATPGRAGNCAAVDPD